MGNTESIQTQPPRRPPPSPQQQQQQQQRRRPPNQRNPNSRPIKIPPAQRKPPTRDQILYNQQCRQEQYRRQQEQRRQEQQRRQQQQRQQEEQRQEQEQQYLGDNTRLTQDIILRNEIIPKITPHNINESIDRFNTYQTNCQEEFEGEQKKREEKFQSEHKDREELFNKEIAKFEDSNYDPYKVLGLNRRNITLLSIKKAYKYAARKYHPDKGGDPEIFKVVTQSYLYLLKKHADDADNKYKLNREVKREDYDANLNEGMKNIHIDKDNFNINKFNEIFDKYRVEDVYEDGYGDMMTNEKRSTDGNDDPAVNSVFGNDFNRDIFNKTFEDEKEESQMAIYREPEALTSFNTSQFRELGKDKIKDFGGKSDGNGLEYMDYKEAYNPKKKFIDPSKVKYKEYRNINELQSARSNITPQSEEERAYQEKKKRMEETRERERQERMRYNDLMYEEQYKKYNRMQIGN